MSVWELVLSILGWITAAVVSLVGAMLIIGLVQGVQRMLAGERPVRKRGESKLFDSRDEDGSR